MELLLRTCSQVKDVLKDLEDKGIIIQAQSKATIIEEKNVREVVDVVKQTGLSKKVCRMYPVGVVKG